MHAAYFKYENGSEPVREWFFSLDRESRRAIGGEIAIVEFDWPVGEPLVKKVGEFWEVRVRLPIGWARVIFTIDGNRMILLHGFVKKSRKPDKHDIEVAKKRFQKFRSRLGG